MCTVGTHTIAFSGELYNWRALAKELAQHGHPAAAGEAPSDAEVALCAHLQWGADALVKLRGVFAFAIYDQATRTLTLARDRIGGKPLFFAHIRRGTPDEALLFATQLKSLLADPAFDRRVDMQALSHYLTYQYVPHPWSIFADAGKVEPGHWLRWHDGHVTSQRYWDLEYEPKASVTFDQAVEAAHEKIDEAMRVRLEDVKRPGIFLSGGVDSSTMVAMMRRHVPGELRTFSMGFREQKFNELPYARQVAEKFETLHEEYVVQPDALEILGELAWQYEEPYADSSAIPTFLVSKLARQHVRVAFLGDGGDESFCGYERYGGFPALNRYERIPRLLRAACDLPFAGLARLLPASAKLELLSYVNHASLAGNAGFYTQTMVIFRDYMKRGLLRPEHRGVLLGPAGDSEALTVALFNKVAGRALVERKTYSDIMLYLPGALIPKVERAAVANGLVARAPMLDHTVMEFAAHLPADLKFQDGQLKRVLKKVAQRYFTEEFLNRPKQGFGVPVGDWFRGELRDFTRDFLMGDRARGRGWFEPAYVGRIFNQHVEGRQNQSHRLWTLLMLEAWARTFLDQSDPLAQGAVRLK